MINGFLDKIRKEDLNDFINIMSTEPDIEYMEVKRALSASVYNWDNFSNSEKIDAIFSAMEELKSERALTKMVENYCNVH